MNPAWIPLDIPCGEQLLHPARCRNKAPPMRETIEACPASVAAMTTLAHATKGQSWYTRVEDAIIYCCAAAASLEEDTRCFFFVAEGIKAYNWLYQHIWRS